MLCFAIIPAATDLYKDWKQQAAKAAVIVSLDLACNKNIKQGECSWKVLCDDMRECWAAVRG